MLKISSHAISVRQVKAARALLGWSQDDLAQNSGVSKPTIARLETGQGTLGGYVATRQKVIAAMAKAGVIFIEQNGDGPGVRLKGRKKRGGSLRSDQLNAEDDD